MTQRVTLFGRARYFFRNYVVHGRVRVFLQYLFTKFQALFIQPTILPYFVTFFPHRKSSYSYMIPKVAPRAEGAELPVPPEKLWYGYGKTAEEWLDSGKKHVGNMRRILDESGHSFAEESRILEFGCAGARMLRCFADEAEKGEVWGTDISADHIVWCKQYLSPPFHFFTTTTAPHLPFEDGYFDFIYAGSVFTHIDDLTDAWLMELRRVPKKDGKLYITIPDNDTIRILSQQKDFIAKTLSCHKHYYENRDFGMFTIGRFMRSQVFYDSEYLTEMLEPFFETLYITPEAYDFQTAFLLRKK